MTRLHFYLTANRIPLKPVKLFLGTIFLVCANLAVFSQEAPLDSASSAVLFQIKKETASNNSKQIVRLFRDHQYLIRDDANLFDQAIKHLFSHGMQQTAIDVLKVNPFLMSQHSEMALYYYYVGIGQMLNKRGWPHFKQAEKSMDRAALELKRSQRPDYGFFSDIENARGYLSITARGLSTDEQKELVCIIRHEFINMAIHHFRDALLYNPDNHFAQRNLDTLIYKLRLADLPIPPLSYDTHAPFGRSVAFDSLNIDSLHNTSNLPLLDYTLLPKNYHLIVEELSQYDEIILCMDLSGSMDDPVGWGPEISKFTVAQQLALFIAVQMRSEVFLGAISVGQDCDQTSMVLHYPIASVSRQEFIMKVDALRPHGHTPLNIRLKMTKEMFSSKQNKKLVFLLSDGMDTCDENPELCNTADMLAGHGIDLSVFSFIYETLDHESRAAYSIYTCMTNPSQGKIYKITHDGGLEDEIEYTPVSNNTLILPPMDTSILWNNNKWLFQFPIKGVEPPVKDILKFE